MVLAIANLLRRATAGAPHYYARRWDGFDYASVALAAGLAVSGLALGMVRGRRTTATLTLAHAILASSAALVLLWTLGSLLRIRAQSGYVDARDLGAMVRFAAAPAVPLALAVAVVVRATPLTAAGSAGTVALACATAGIAESAANALLLWDAREFVESRSWGWAEMGGIGGPLALAALAGVLALPASRASAARGPLLVAILAVTELLVGLPFALRFGRRLVGGTWGRQPDLGLALWEAAGPLTCVVVVAFALRAGRRPAATSLP